MVDVFLKMWSKEVIKKAEEGVSDFEGSVPGAKGSCRSSQGSGTHRLGGLQVGVWSISDLKEEGGESRGVFGKRAHQAVQCQEAVSCCGGAETSCPNCEGRQRV